MLYRSFAFIALLAACGDSSPATTDASAPAPDAAHVDAAPDATPDAPAGVDFTEDYGATTLDVGNWILTTNTAAPRELRTTGGNPDGYLYGEAGSAIPTWATASPRYQPGVDDGFKRDSIFVGAWDTNAIEDISVDLQIFQVGTWTPDRAVTLHLMTWDAVNDGVAYEAFYSLPDFAEVPTGWGHYDFPVDARATTVPAGWMFTRGDGTPGTDADWALFMHQIDLVAFGFWKPGYGYPSHGVWQLGIDNIHISATPPG